MLASLKRLSGEQGGFSLIEMMAVVAIIGVITAVAVPKVVGAVSKAKKAADRTSLNAVVAALDEYYAQNGQYPEPANAPSGQDVKDVLQPYLKRTFIWHNSAKQSLVYVTTNKGRAYALVDPQGESLPANGQLTVTCDTKVAPGSSVFVPVTEGESADLVTTKFGDTEISNCRVNNPRMYIISSD